MADVLNLETESTPLNTELETPELESVTELHEPSLETTSNPLVSAVVDEVESEATDIEEPAPEAVASALATVAAESDAPEVHEVEVAESAVAEAPVAQVSAPEAVAEVPVAAEAAASAVEEAPAVTEAAPVAEVAAEVVAPVEEALVVEVPVAVAAPAPVIAPVVHTPAPRPHYSQPARPIAQQKANTSAPIVPVVANVAPSHDHDFDMGEDFSAQLEAFEREQAAEAAAVEAYGDSIVAGTVIKLTDKHAVIDVGLKSEGLLPIEQVLGQL
jgi:hypothetical protein